MDLVVDEEEQEEEAAIESGEIAFLSSVRSTCSTLPLLSPPHVTTGQRL